MLYSPPNLFPVASLCDLAHILAMKPVARKWFTASMKPVSNKSHTLKTHKKGTSEWPLLGITIS